MGKRRVPEIKGQKQAIRFITQLQETCMEVK